MLRRDLSSLEAVLLLRDGTVFRGKGFGSPKKVVGEVVFNTGMVGYTETLTDPSYRGQILCFTYPMIGNYGVPSYEHVEDDGFPTFFESNRIQSLGVIVHDLCVSPNHWRSTKSFNDWLVEEDIPGIHGVDTRTLTKKLRMHGVMMGILEISEKGIDEKRLVEELGSSKSYDELNLVEEVSVHGSNSFGLENKPTIVLIDCGVKYGIIRNLLARGFRVIRVRYDSSSSEILSHNPIGVVVSNGPGDPKMCTSTIKTIREVLEMNVPTLGICLGNQLLALALGGETFKLKYGHRGQNKPCVDLSSGLSYVTSQNHGYSVDPQSLPGTGLETWFVNADDQTIEGIKHESKPCLAVQFHPEASPGPYDTGFVFDIFQSMIVRR